MGLAVGGGLKETSNVVVDAAAVVPDIDWHQGTYELGVCGFSQAEPIGRGGRDSGCTRVGSRHCCSGDDSHMHTHTQRNAILTAVIRPRRWFLYHVYIILYCIRHTRWIERVREKKKNIICDWKQWTSRSNNPLLNKLCWQDIYTGWRASRTLVTDRWRLFWNRPKILCIYIYMGTWYTIIMYTTSCTTTYTPAARR